ncbi:MAG: hypothetical protein Q8S22_10890 [Eubacteriales bacterium]|jgi:hypothetical protein|nr:hypothetical protein [Eubacteriales bacterium]
MHSENFSAAWDARDELVDKLRREECLPLRMLYVRNNEGGALAAGLLPGHAGLVLIDWRGSAFTTRVLREPELTTEPIEQKADGFGGMFGFGEKGAHGWLLRFLERGEPVAEVELYPTITAFADMLASDDRFLHGRRKPRQIPLWQLKPEARAFCETVISLWVRLVREAV